MHLSTHVLSDSQSIELDSRVAGHSGDGVQTMPFTLPSPGIKLTFFFIAHVISWARAEDGSFLIRQGNRVLEALMLTRRDNGKVCFPGGFVNPGESSLRAAHRKLAEETLAYELVGILNISYSSL